MSTLFFTVDAALLRELGERLIGQPHIALAELVKNSYDADGATCRIEFSDDRIEILDDGKGMSFKEFSELMHPDLPYWVCSAFSGRTSGLAAFSQLHRSLQGATRKALTRAQLVYFIEGNLAGSIATLTPR